MIPRRRPLLRGLTTPAWLCGTVLLAACPAHTPTPRPTPACPSLETIAAGIEARAGETTLEGSFKAGFHISGGRKRLEGELLVQADTGLRVELFSMLGPPVAYAAVTPRRAAVYLPYADNTFLESATPDRFLEHLTGGSLDVDRLIRLFLGRLPPCEVQPPLTCHEGAHRVDVACVGERQTYRLSIDPDTLLVIRIADAGDGPATFSCDLDDYREVGSSRLPMRIHLESGTTLEADIRFTRLEAREPVTPEAFELQAPPNARKLPLESVVTPE